MTALLLAGHGSHISPNTAGLVWSFVDQLRARGAADEVGACFWKEPPSFRNVLGSFCSNTVVVVPVLAADGYFARTVIPTEMGLDGPLTRSGNRCIHYASPLGLHPRLGDVLHARVLQQMDTLQVETHELAVAIIGHGTRRDPRSREAARRFAGCLTARMPGLHVLEAYLDDDPPIASIYERTQAPVILAAPWFLAPGSHVSVDVPEALGLLAGATSGRSRGRSVYYLDAPGTADVTCDLILELAQTCEPAIGSCRSRGNWRCFPGQGVQHLWREVCEQGELTFGELLLTPTCVQPVGSGQGGTRVCSPTQLRRLVREGPFRPLPEAQGLPTGWYAETGDARTLAAVVETVYPGTLADWSADRRGTLKPETLQDVAARQTGNFRNVDMMSSSEITMLSTELCGHCARQPTWNGANAEANKLPCREPCNLWLSKAIA
ncbi:MAG: DR2241 family protein [Anaerolineaceae bacterium]|nr:DR2241 family protein [Anaerolineaceae bacterium]